MVQDTTTTAKSKNTSPIFTGLIRKHIRSPGTKTSTTKEEITTSQKLKNKFLVMAMLRSQKTNKCFGIICWAMVCDPVTDDSIVTLHVMTDEQAVVE
jgi:hypothetical protein